MNYRVEKWDRVEKPDSDILRAVLETEGYRVYQWSDPPSVVYGLHKHSEDQSHWIISGSLELTIEGFGTVVLNAGDRDFMPAGAFHSARVIGNEAVVYLIGEKS